MEAMVTAFTISSFRVTWLHLLIAIGAVVVLCVALGIILEKKPRIQIRSALRSAVTTATKNPGDMIWFLVAEFCIFLICFVHLLFLVSSDVIIRFSSGKATQFFGVVSPEYLKSLEYFQKLDYLKNVEDLQVFFSTSGTMLVSIKYLAILTILWWVFWALPARVNSAAAMQDALEGGRVCTYRLLERERWWRKIWNGLKNMLFLVPWAVPMAAGMYFGYSLWKGGEDKDAFTLLQQFQEFGGGDVKISILYTLLIVTGLILIIMIGLALNSGSRHALALGNPKLLKGHHGKLALGWFCATFVFMLPFWIALAVILVPIIRVLVTDLNSLYLHTANLPSRRTMLLIIGAGSLLTVPLIPFRSLMIAEMVHQLKEKEEKAAP